MTRTGLLLAALTALFMVLGAQLGMADDRSQVKVKQSKVYNGVLVVDIVKGGKPAQLTCNDGQPACTSLKAGDYWLVELPENHGMYDCKNAEIYPGDKDPGDADDRDESKRVGAYCLAQN